MVPALTSRTDLVLLMLAALVACRADKPTEKAEAAPAQDKQDDEQDADERPTSALAEARADVTKHMAEHFEQGHTLQTKLVVGDLPGAKAAAREIAGLSPKSYPADWLPYIMSMRQSAEITGRADDLVSAAAGAGAIAGACGNCHRALGKGPTLDPSEPPQDDPSGMKRHKWAATQMWHGIIGPSDAAWSAGTQQFGQLPECRPDFGGEIDDRKAIEDARAHVGELTERASTLTDADARAKLYGEYLGGCGTCHAAGC